MADSYNCLRLDNGGVFQVDYYKEGNDIFFDIGGNRILFDKVKVGHVAKLISREGKFKDSDVLNLWKVGVDKSKLNSKDDIRNHGGVSMKYEHYFERYFEIDRKLTDNIHIVVDISTTTTELGRKRPFTKKESKKCVIFSTATSTKRAKRRWTVNSTLMQEDRDIFYYVEPEGNDTLFEMIQKREYVAMYGARASGKSTRVQQIGKLLRNIGFDCIYVSFEHVDLETNKERFWSTLGSSIILDAEINIDFESASAFFGSSDDLEINSHDDFLRMFRKNNWNNNIVLLIDEFDKLYEANENVRSSCLEIFLGMKNSRNNYAIWSIVAIGTFSILFLKSEKTTTSPFNVDAPFSNPNFTWEQVQFLYNEFANDFSFTIDPKIIKDIYKRTSGHAGLVCLCGRSIQNNLIKEIVDNKLSFSSWLKFALDQLQNEILEYSTFNKMIEILNTKNSKPAIGLLRSKFLGFFDFVPIHDSEELKLVKFLVAEGVLIRDETNKNMYKTSSALVDGLIRRRVIPEVYKSSPDVAVPVKDGGYLDTLKILQTAIQFFDKNNIINGFAQSFKIAHNLYVSGYKKQQVPRESVYDTELSRILTNWLVKECDVEITGQWHMVESRYGEKDKHSYSDIVIIAEEQLIVLELLATATENQLNEHFKRVLEYAEKLSADDIWIVHFTCEDGYAIQKLQWPSDNRINVVHFFHDRMFVKVLMNVRYVDSSGTVSYIVDQDIPLLFINNIDSSMRFL